MKSKHVTTGRAGSHFCKNPGAGRTIHHLQLLQLLRIYCTWYREDLSLTAVKGLRHKADKLGTLCNRGTAVFAKRHQLQEIKMDLSQGNEKTTGVFVFGSETKQLGWIPKENISEVERMDQMDLKISLITFKEKDISFHFSKIDYMS